MTIQPHTHTYNTQTNTNQPGVLGYIGCVSIAKRKEVYGAHPARSTAGSKCLLIFFLCTRATHLLLTCSVTVVVAFQVAAPVGPKI